MSVVRKIYQLTFLCRKTGESQHNSEEDIIYASCIAPEAVQKKCVSHRSCALAVYLPQTEGQPCMTSTGHLQFKLLKGVYIAVMYNLIIQPIKFN